MPSNTRIEPPGSTCVLRVDNYRYQAMERGGRGRLLLYLVFSELSSLCSLTVRSHLRMSIRDKDDCDYHYAILHQRTLSCSLMRWWRHIPICVPVEWCPELFIIYIDLGIYIYIYYIHFRKEKLNKKPFYFVTNIIIIFFTCIFSYHHQDITYLFKKCPNVFAK